MYVLFEQRQQINIIGDAFSFSNPNDSFSKMNVRSL